MIEVELFVAVLGVSNYTYAEATRTQRLADFVASNRLALEFFGGVLEVIVPDQLRSAVKGPDRLDPEINSTYAEFAEHYNTAIVLARPGKPRDKSKVENAVVVVQRWILGDGRANLLAPPRWHCRAHLGPSVSRVPPLSAQPDIAFSRAPENRPLSTS